MTSINIFKEYLEKAAYTPAKLGEINTLIFHEWDETKAKEFLPPHVIEFISRNQENENIMNEIHHLLLPVDLRTE